MKTGLINPMQANPIEIIITHFSFNLLVICALNKAEIIVIAEYGH